MEPQVMVAIITAITTIILALLTFPPIIEFFEKEPTPTIVPAIPDATILAATIEPTQSLMDTETSVPAPTFTDTPSPTATATNFPTFTHTPTYTFTSTVTATKGLPVGMDVQLITNTTSGKSPLKVNFDARGSFLRDAEGKIFNCSGGLCDYTWYVYQGSKLLNKPESSHNGTFNYRFGSAGDYRVVVIVCRGAEKPDCASDAANISVN
jgi:hypothetical protein